MFARSVKYLEDHQAALAARDRMEAIRADVTDGDVYIARAVIAPPVIERMKRYLAGIGRGSLPNYRAIEPGAPNFHRLNAWDERAYVKGCFHQFSFFPWNQDVFGLFALARDVYRMKNLLSGNEPDRFLRPEPEAGCVSRLSFQFYPRGGGGLHRHSDPVDHHQLAVPTLIMSTKGVDFQRGGAYVETANGERICLDDVTRPGDVVYFNARIPHGVEAIDPDAELDWPAFEGRWMLLFAINKLAGTSAVADAVDLEDAPHTP